MRESGELGDQVSRTAANRLVSALVEVSRYLRWHLNGRAIQVVGDARRKARDFIHVTDAVRGLVAIAARAQPGEILNVGSGTEVSMRDLAERIQRLAEIALGMLRAGDTLFTHDGIEVRPETCPTCVKAILGSL